MHEISIVKNASNTLFNLAVECPPHVCSCLRACSRLAKNLPGGAAVPSVIFSGPFAKLWSFFGQLLSPLGFFSSRSNLNESALQVANLVDADVAEKFAIELLWIAEKLLDCGGMEVAVQQWSSVSYLAELSLRASPKVQKSLVRLSSTPLHFLSCYPSNTGRAYPHYLLIWEIITHGFCW